MSQRLADLGQSAKNLQLLYETLQDSVREAAQAGATWEQIGQALGVRAGTAEAYFGSGVVRRFIEAP